ncbi:hypothetical protein INT43_005244 [Umbelopsis isabellina]|uniref:Eukaryotic translation initiation factor 4E n=1 Tax=Mortierella isabellina TaxID=91625 RepID=A0A8H7PHU0_MORIS|nr:hypothetical protein INT43_005244 [Umbelopsis isabellina]
MADVTEKVVVVENDKMQDPALQLDYSVKHPLHQTWTLWFDNPGRKNSSQNWAQNLKEVFSFSTVEDFWSSWSNVVRATRLDVGSNCFVFKQGIRPEWEDPINENGGKFSIQFQRTKQMGEAVNQLWLYSILACIGEQFKNGDEICGVVLSVRKSFFRLALWTKTANNKEVAEALGSVFCQEIKDLLELGDATIEFMPHGDQAEKPELLERFAVGCTIVE